MTRSITVAATIAAALALPNAALAQRQLDPVRVTAASTAEADSIEARALRFELSSIRHFNKVARMHERSASLRGADDPKAFESLQMAALLRYGSGDRAKAVANMSRAAEHAAARGDVMNAARAYGNAALIAAELRQRDRVVEYAGAAQLLSASPLLTDTQRMELRARVPLETRVAMVGPQ